jgi:hypothetical protein
MTYLHNLFHESKCVSFTKSLSSTSMIFLKCLKTAFYYSKINIANIMTIISDSNLKIFKKKEQANWYYNHFFVFNKKLKKFINLKNLFSKNILFNNFSLISRKEFDVWAEVIAQNQEEFYLNNFIDWFFYSFLWIRISFNLKW